MPDSIGDSPVPYTVRSPIVRALRGAGDEVQFGLTLEALCQESAVAKALAYAVIAQSKQGNARAKRAAGRDGGMVTCMGEQRLNARVSRRMARSRAAGRVDLRFTGDDDWRFGLELKINSPFGHKQLERYAEWGPIAAVVRSFDQIDGLPALKSHASWVGAATWRALLPDLRRLPVSTEWNRDWQALLDVMEDDGDFDEKKPEPREVKAQVDLLNVLAPLLLDHFVTTLEKL